MWKETPTAKGAHFESAHRITANQSNTLKTLPSNVRWVPGDAVLILSLLRYRQKTVSGKVRVRMSRQSSTRSDVIIDANPFRRSSLTKGSQPSLGVRLVHGEVRDAV